MRRIQYLKIPEKPFWNGIPKSKILKWYSPFPDDETFLGMDHLVVAHVQVLEDGDVPDEPHQSLPIFSVKKLQQF